METKKKVDQEAEYICNSFAIYNDPVKGISCTAYLTMNVGRVKFVRGWVNFRNITKDTTIQKIYSRALELAALGEWGGYPDESEDQKGLGSGPGPEND